MTFQAARTTYQTPNNKQTNANNMFPNQPNTLEGGGGGGGGGGGEGGAGPVYDTGCRGEGEGERGIRKRNKRTRDRILTQSNFFLFFPFFSSNYCYLHCTRTCTHTHII